MSQKCSSYYVQKRHMKCLLLVLLNFSQNQMAMWPLAFKTPNRW